MTAGLARISAGLPSAIFAPKFSTTIRSQSAMINAMKQKIEPGQKWLMNREVYGAMTIHVLATFVDMAGKHKIAIQPQFPDLVQEQEPTVGRP